MEHVKNFGYSQKKLHGRDEYIIELDKEKNVMTYLALQAKIAV